MPAYAYKIQIKKQHQIIKYEEYFYLDDNVIEVNDIANLVGNNCFSLDTIDNYSGYKITVYRSRLETDTERDYRVNREKSYMKEYNKRHVK